MVRPSSSEVTLGCSLLPPWASVSPPPTPTPRAAVSTPRQAPLPALVSSNGSGDRHKPAPALGQGAPRKRSKENSKHTYVLPPREPAPLDGGWALPGLSTPHRGKGAPAPCGHADAASPSACERSEFRGSRPRARVLTGHHAANQS